MNLLRVLLLFSIMYSCEGQNNPPIKSYPKNTTMTTDKFDIENFNKHQQNNEWNYLDKDGNTVREIKDESTLFENNQFTSKLKMQGYIVEIRQKNNPFNINKSYHPNLNLKSEGVSFHDGFLVGIWKEYNQNGELIKETNYDIPYQNYPWEELEKYLKNKKVDLMNPYTRVNRKVEENNTPKWYLEWDTGKKNESMFQIIHNVEINAITGKVIKEFDTYREP